MHRMLIAAALVAVPAAAFAQTAATSAGATARASFVNADGKTIGTATLTQTPNGVLIQAEVTGLPPGEHAFHVHEAGVCDPATKFESAKGHFSGGKQHGYLVAGGPHLGDMPNQFVPADGVLRLNVVNTGISLGEGTGNVFDQDGSAIVLHAGVDDYKSQPSGNAGGRIACAVIQKP